ncbi:MAG: M1 family peptidase, partial [Dehalococcoidia bacterium]|nr:M1 family peptidase [Dehalococcoidia bacterium]
MTSSNEWKLPTDVRPTLYTLTLEPDLESFTFTGSETIAIEVDEPASLIAMNSSEIAIQSATLSLSNGSEIQPESITFDEEKETVTLAFTETVPVGAAELSIEFTGELNDKLRGFYRSTYTDVDGNQRWMATTQFEATDARRAFPCWDEPAVKAAFDITLVVPQELEAISNTEPVSITNTDDGKKVVHYAETPVMSTYLLAFIVGDLACVQDRTRDGVLMRVWATRGNEDKGQYALETSMALLDYFHDYFGVPYPLSKLDHIAIPDFAAGAMENWGAITYREVALLVDPVDSSAGTREIVAAIISHEMAHQWFGDLVTMEWWDDLWLNESFASWMGDKAVDYLHPEWEMWTQFLTHDTSSALNLDGLRNSHPIEQPVNNPAEIGELFDAISYSKGGSVLRMLEHYLCEDDFREGLRLYIQRHQYANARTRDLWNALGEASGQPVAEIMDSWTSQTGYPVLEASVNRSGESIEVGLYQSRFLYDEIL